VTVHTSQGGQWPEVQVSLDDLAAAAGSNIKENGLPLWRRLMYVAVTRAEEKVYLVTGDRLTRGRDFDPMAENDRLWRKHRERTIRLNELAQVGVGLGAGAPAPAPVNVPSLVSVPSPVSVPTPVAPPMPIRRLGSGSGSALPQLPVAAPPIPAQRRSTPWSEMAEIERQEALERARVKGRCHFCGRALTDPVSAEIGAGPVCRKRHGVEH
jgi:hypothetical protein